MGTKNYSCWVWLVLSEHIEWKGDAVHCLMSVDH